MPTENPAGQAETPAAETVKHDQIFDLDAERAEAPAQEDTEEVKPEDAKAKAPDQAETETAEDSDEDDDDGESPAPKKRSGTARLKARLAAAQAEIEALRRVAPKQDDAAALQSQLEQEIGPAPKEADFADFLEYQEAKYAYSAAKLVVSRDLKQQAEKAKQFQELAEQEVVEAFRERAETTRKNIKDFDEVTNSATLSPQHPDVVGLILSSNKGPEIAYHLSKNPKIVQRLNEMSPVNAAREIGKLEASLSSATPKTVSKAPSPVEPLRGGIAPPSRDPEKMSMNEYRAWRANGGGR